MRRYLTKFDAAMRDALAHEFGVDPKVLWDVLDGKSGPPRFVRGLVYSVAPLLTETNLHEAHDDGLPSVSNGVTIDTAMQTQATQGIRGARPTESPAAEKLRAAGVTFAEVATECDVPYSTARSWFQRGKAGRPVPPKHAATLLKKHDIEASDLPNGVAEK